MGLQKKGLKKWGRKGLSLVLVLAMVLTSIPQTAYATQTETVTEEVTEEIETENKETEDVATNSETEEYTLPEKWKVFNYALFTSGEEVFSLNTSEAVILGDVHSNSAFHYRGSSIAVDGNIEAGTDIQVETAGGADEESMLSKIENAEILDIPDINNELKEYVEKNGTIYDKSMTFNNESPSIEKPVRVEGDVSFLTTAFEGQGIMYARDSITYNVGSSATPEDSRLFLASENGNITLNGAELNMNAVLYAPNGTVTINAASINLNGRIIANQVILNGSVIHITKSEHDLDMLDFIFAKELRPPIADFEIPDSCYLRNTEGIVAIEIQNHAYSPDEDKIDKIIYEIYHDKNGDNEFEEDELIEQKKCDEEKWVYKTSLVGKYQIKQIVKEEIAEELDEEYSIEEIETLTTAEVSKTFEVQNQKPETALSIQKKNNVDILFAVQSDNETNIAECKSQQSRLEEALREKDIDVVSSFGEIAKAEKKDEFDWEEYGHDVKEEGNLHLVTGKNSAEFLGYRNEKYKDFAYTDLAETEYKVLSFTIEQNSFNGLEGTGMLFGASIDKKEKSESYNGHTYKLFDNGKEWSEAQKLCEEQGGYLATITSQEEYNYIEKNILHEDKYNMYWLGGYKDYSKGAAWTWITHEDFNWSRWAYGEPNGQNESVIELYGKFGQRGYWNDTLAHLGYGGAYGCDNIATLCEWNGSEISGYILLLTAQGMKLIKLNHTDIYNLQNGSYEYLDNAGEILGTFPYDITKTSHNISMIFEKNKITIKDNGDIIVKDFEIKDEIKGTGVGPIVSYTKPQTEIEDKPQNTFVKNIEVSMDEGKTLQELIEANSWRDGAKHLVVCYADEFMQEFTEELNIGNCIESLYDKEAVFLGIGNEENAGNWKKIEKAFDRSYTDYSAEKWEKLYQYITAFCENGGSEITDYITTNDVISYSGVYKDAENDPMYKQYWEYKYKPLTENEEELVCTEEENPVEKFNVPGVYGIKLRVQDNPIGDNDALSYYRLWSDEDTYEKLLVVQQRPVADVEADVLEGSENQNIVNVKYTAEDTDHMQDAKKGIRQEIFSYKNIEDDEWTDGRIPNKVESGEIYLVRYQVKDIEGSWSKPIVKVVDTTKEPGIFEFDDTEQPEIFLNANKKVFEFGESVSVDGYATDNYGIRSFELFIDGEKVTDTLGCITFTPYKEGYINISAKAVDISGNEQEKSIEVLILKKETEAEEDKVCPNFNVEQIAFNDDKSQIEFRGTVTDDIELSCYRLFYKDSEEKEVIIGEGTDEVTESSILANLPTENLITGDYVITFYAEDTSGNTLTQDITITYSRTEQTIESETKEPEEGGENIEGGETGGESSENKEFEIALNSTVAAVDDTIEIMVIIPEEMDSSSLQVKNGDTEIPMENGVGVFIPEKTGDYTFTATVKNAEGEEVSKEAVCKVYDLSDKTAPEIKITTPKQEEVLTDVTKVTGSVTDNKEVESYLLEYAMEGSREYTCIAEGSGQKKDEMLGTIDTTMLMNGKYNLRLTAKDKGGNTSFVEQQFTVEGNLKVGAMHIGFTDITSEIGGTKVAVNRMYDSRNKQKGDFGIGWTLGMQGLEIYENSPLSDGYEMVQSGSLFSTTYRISETKNHDVTIAYGDGTSDHFELVITPDRKALVPISEVTLGYRCVTNQKVKLEILGEPKAYVSGSELIFYEESMYNALSYKLTTEDGVKIYIKSGKGVYQIEDTNDNLITVDKDGYHAKDGKSITFKRDKEGRIITATDVAGNVTKYVYDKQGDLVTVTDSADRTVTFTYDKEHNLASITDPMGVAVARNEYDDDGRLIATIDADGNRVEYDYDVEGRTQSVTDRRGNTTVYTYDDNGNILQTVDAYGNKTNNTYDEHNNLLSTTDAENHTTSYSYDSSGNVTQVTAADGTKVESTYTQDNLVSSVEMLDKTVMALQYDDRGRITSVEDANGNATEYSYTADGKLSGLTDEIGEYQRITYDAEGNVASTTNGAGESASYTYDKDGRCTSVTISRIENGETKTFTSHYSYNDAGDITESVDNAGNITTYEYDLNGNRTAAVDAEGRRITYSYDEEGNLIKTGYPDGTFESFTYDANGNNLTATDRSGLTVSMTYDKLDRLTVKTYADGTKETYSYDKVGNLTKHVSTSGAETAYAYDSRNRNTSITDVYGYVTAFEYDEAARLTRRIDAAGNETSYAYDDNGNIIKTTFADGNSITSEYDERNRIISQKDQNGNETKYAYDGADRLVSVEDAYGSIFAYGYDGNGNMITVTDAEGNVTTYSYDEVGRIKTLTNALGKTMEYGYDKTGNLTGYKDYAGTVITYAYDNMNRLVKKTVGSDTVSYRYSDKGQLIEVTDKSGTVSYTYDKYNRLETQTDVRGNTLSYNYDREGRLITFDNGFGKTSYEYDLLDRVTKVIDRNGKATVYEYDIFGNRSAVRYPNGNVMSYTYDACQRLKEECITNAGGVVLSKYTYGLGKAGERLSITEENSMIVTELSYDYDKLNRLVKETIECNDSKLINEYSYDKNSNRTEKKTTIKGDITEIADTSLEEAGIKEGTTTYTYNALNQLVTEQSEDTVTMYTYDDNGNLITQSGDKTVDYSYDKENHLLRATIQKGNSVTVESYTYDYAGNRTSKTVNDTDVTYYVNDTTGSLTQVVAETNKDGRETAFYTRGEDLISMEKGSEIWYYLYDGHESVRLLTNDAGRITDRYAYDAYGNLLKKAGETENEFLYTGEQYNANTGLYYLRVRYMNPGTGTFISMDSYQGSIYDPVSLHKYLYANANPVMYTDPSGYNSLKEYAVVGIGMLAISGAMILSDMAALNIFSSLRRNLSSLITQMVVITPIDWKQTILIFPSHDYDSRWIITTVMILTSSDLFKAIYEVEATDDEVETPGVPEESDDEANGEETVTSNLGNTYDNTPSKHHSETDDNPVKGQEPNSSVDIKDKNGRVVRRRWFDSEGKAERDLDYTDHGNPGEHNEVPHEHIWDWNKIPPRQ